MSSTALDHRLVRDYLRALDAAMYTMPAAQARELREQITAHLDEALPPDADDQEVAATLSRLGSPADLAAEAGVASAGSHAAAVNSGARQPGRLARVRGRTWIVAGLAVILVAAGAKYADVFLSAGPLQFTNGADWWYRQDASHQVIATADNTTQNTTPIRSGQRQGYVVSIYNGTNVTQTIVGDASGPSLGWDAFGGRNERIAVSVSNVDIANGLWGSHVSNVRFTLPVAIPPFQTRLVLVLWTSDLCLSKGESTGIDKLYLRVRVGWFTRTEIISQQGWYLLGPSHGRCV